jgi:hypothetical protein
MEDNVLYLNDPRSTGRIRRLLFSLSISVAALAVAGSLAGTRGQAPEPAVDGKVLYLVEFVRTDNDDKNVDRLVRATLKADGTLTKEIVFTAKRYFLGDPGKARIVKGRYVVTEYGGIIDAREGRVLLEQGSSGQLLGVEEGKVVYRVYDLFAPRLDKKVPKEIAEKLGDWEFDLAKGTRARPAEKHWALTGTPSPDRSRAVYAGAPGTLWLEQGNGMPKQLGKGFTVTHSKHAESTFDRRAPVLWLDNERILTQQGNGKLVIVDTTGTVTQVCEIAGAPAVNDSPRLTRDPKNRIIYQCGRAEYVIDVDRKSAAPLEEVALGHGFETPVETGPRGFRTIYYKGQAIGSGVFVPADIRTGPEVIAEWNLGDPGARRYVGVLWTKLGFAWRGLDMDYCRLIGWAD